MSDKILIVDDEPGMRGLLCKVMEKEGYHARAVPDAAEALKLTSRELLRLGHADTVISEPLGGAHRSIHDTVYSVEQYIVKTLRDLKRTKTENLLQNRYKKLRSLGTPTTRSTSVKKPETARAAAEKFKKAGKIEEQPAVTSKV